jgi:DNA-binding CsgD family transcriptional regulator
MAFDTRAALAREAVIKLGDGALEPPELLYEAAERVRRVVPYDLGGWMTMDPDTLLPTGNIRSGKTPELTQAFWRNELFTPDVHKFTELVRRRSPVAVMSTVDVADLTSLLLRLHGLSAREREVAELLMLGPRADEIAARLHISRHTLRDHVKAIFAKVGAKSRSELTALVGGPPAPDLVWRLPHEAKVSQAPGSPCSNPVVSHCWRCWDEPWVQSWGEMVPVALRCWKSSPTTAAARSASSKSAWVSCPRW